MILSWGILIDNILVKKSVGKTLLHSDRAAGLEIVMVKVQTFLTGDVRRYTHTFYFIFQ